jgi:hypothetical protein
MLRIKRAEANASRSDGGALFSVVALLAAVAARTEPRDGAVAMYHRGSLCQTGAMLPST